MVHPPPPRHPLIIYKTKNPHINTADPRRNKFINNNKQQSLWRNHKYRKRRFQQNYTKIRMITWWILTYNIEETSENNI